MSASLVSPLANLLILPVQPPVMALGGLAIGIGFTAALVVLGASRELIGQGTLFDGAHLMFGEAARGWTLSLGDDYPGVLLAILPPGAFLGLGMMIAVKNLIDKGLARRQSEAALPQGTTEPAA